MSVTNITVNNTPKQSKVELNLSSEDVRAIQAIQGDGAKHFQAGSGVNATRQEMDTPDGKITMVSMAFQDGAGSVEFHKSGKDGKPAFLGHDDAVAIGAALKAGGLKAEAPHVTRTLDDAIVTSKQTGQAQHISGSEVYR